MQYDIVVLCVIKRNTSTLSWINYYNNAETVKHRKKETTIMF